MFKRISIAILIVFFVAICGNVFAKPGSTSSSMNSSPKPVLISKPASTGFNSPMRNSAPTSIPRTPDSAQKSPAPFMKQSDTGFKSPMRDSTPPMTTKPSDTGFKSPMRDSLPTVTAKPTDTNPKNTASAVPGNIPAKTEAQKEIERRMNKQASADALKEYRKEKEAKNNPAPTVDVNKEVPRGYSPSIGGAAPREKVIVKHININYGNWHRPYYATNTHYRNWNNDELWYMLDHLNDARYAAMYRANMYDPDMIAFRDEVARLSASNAELRAKVNQMNSIQNNPDLSGNVSYPAPNAVAPPAPGNPPKKSNSGFPWGAAFLGIIIVGGIYIYLSKKE